MGIVRIPIYIMKGQEECNNILQTVSKCILEGMLFKASSLPYMCCISLVHRLILNIFDMSRVYNTVR